MPGTIADPSLDPFALRGTECLGHLAFQHLLQQILHNHAQCVVVCAHQIFDGGYRWFILTPGHGGAPMELVTLDITSLPWPLKSSTDFCRTSRTLPEFKGELAKHLK